MLWRGLCVLMLVLCAGTAPAWSQASSQAFSRASSQGQPMLMVTPASEALLAEARDALFDFRLDEAEQLLQRLSARPDGGPAAAFHLTSAALMRFLMSDADAAYDAFHARADAAKDLVSDLQPSPWRDYILAEIDFQRAVALAKRDDFIRGAWAGRSAFKQFERLVAEFPDFYDAYKALGLLHLTIGTMPGSYRFILRILGYSGSIEQGLQELETAYEKSLFNREEAAVFLGLSHSMLYLSDERGTELVGGVYREDPASVLTSYIYGFMLISARQTEEAADILRRTKAASADADYFYIDYIDFYLAEAEFRNGRFSAAVPHYKAYIAKHPGKAGKAMAHFHLGLALEVMGRRDEALRYYEAVRAARAFDSDEAARRKAETLLAAPLSRRDSLLLAARCAYDSGRLAEAEATLGALVADDAVTDEQRAEAGYRLGRVYHAMGRFAAAMNAYRIGMEHGRDSRGRWAPWGQFFIGKIHEREGRLDAARDAYKKAIEYGGKYDYHRALEQAVRTALALIDA